MKLLVFNTLYTPNIIGGAEKSVQLLVEKLLKLGNEVTVVTTGKEDKVDQVNGVKVYYLHHRNLYLGAYDSDKQSVWKKMLWHAKDIYNPKFVGTVQDIINKEQPNVIHTNNLTGFSMVPWILAKKNNIPVVHTLRDFNLMCVKSTMFKKGENCKGRCGTCSLYSEYKKHLSNSNHVDYLVGNSQFMIDSHKNNGYFQGVPSKRIFNGAVLDEPLKSSNTGEYSKKQKVKFFYMGRIEETKGVKVLLDTFNNHSSAELYLAGKIYDEEIKIKSEQNGYSENINFLGYVNPRDWLPKMNVLVAPSLWNEPLPRVILEAYSHLKPVIGTDRGGIPECIENGVTGFIFNPDQQDSLRSIIDEILNNPNILNQMTQNIPLYINQFDINISVNDYIEIFQKAIKEHKN